MIRGVGNPDKLAFFARQLREGHGLRDALPSEQAVTSG